MGQEKQEYIQHEDEYQSKNACILCGVGIPLEEKEIFEETGRCSYCENLLNDDD